MNKMVVHAMEDTDVKKKNQLTTIWYRYKKNKLAIIGLSILLFWILIAIFADVIVDYKEKAVTQIMTNRLQPPSFEHLFGTDSFGRDLFARVIHGSRISIFMGVLTIVIALLIGSLIGAVSGYFGGKIDDILMRIMDVFLAIPSTLLAISIVAALGVGLINLLIAMSISQIPRFARIIRASIISLMGQEFIAAAKACGAKNGRIIYRHIIPNAIGPILVQSTLSLANVILIISAFSFIGLGIRPPTPEWGSMLADGRDYMRNFPYLVIIPGMAIVTAVMSLNLIGDGLRDALDPKLRG